MRLKYIFLSFILVNFVSCKISNKDILIQGSGATFPAALYYKLFSLYTKKTGISITYQAIGSGAGIQNIHTKIVDFGATDTFLSDKEMEEYPGLLHIPAALAAVNFAYHIPGIENTLCLNAEIIFDIYTGYVSNWNDKRIQELNPEIMLPDLKIIPIYRSDSSGTTFIMSEFMSKANKDWEAGFGTSKSINWIEGIGQKGNAAIMGYTKANKGSIAYVDLVYAIQNNLPVAKIQNKSGNYVISGIENAYSAALMNDIPKDTRVSLTYANGKTSAPMASFSYILVHQEQKYDKRTLAKAQELVKLLLWMYSEEAQSMHKELYFSPMPENIITLGLNIINKITYDGTPIVSTLIEKNRDR